MSIEDDMFLDALEASRLKRTQSMYEPSTYPHKCSMCGAFPSGYMLKVDHVLNLGIDTPYMFICEECLNELEV